MESADTFQIVASELSNQLATRIDSTFEKIICGLLRRKYELNLIGGALKDETVENDKELNALKNCTMKKLESLISVKQELETACNMYEIDIKQILHKQNVIEEAIKFLDQQRKDSQTKTKKKHKIFLQKLKWYKNSIVSCVNIDDSDLGVFTFYFFTEKKPSNDMWLAKMKLKDQNIELIHTIPELPRKDEMAYHLAATRDLKGFIYCVYKNFRFRQVN